MAPTSITLSGGVVCATSADGLTCNGNTSGGGRKRQASEGFIDCDFSTLTCADGKQLTGCRIPGANGGGKSERNDGQCGVTQGDGRDTGAAVPSGVSAPASSATATQISSPAATSAVANSAAATSAPTTAPAAASASASPKSNGAIDIKSHSVGSLFAVGGALISMLF